MQIDTVRKEVLNTFKDLVFTEESHSYYVGIKEYISVSTQLKKFYTPFPAEVIAPFSAKKWNKNNPLAEKKTAADLLAEWKLTADIACERGTGIHLFGEEYPNFSEPDCIEKEAIVKYFKDMHPDYKVLVLELQMYSPELNYSGTADIILYNTRTGKIKIADYKTNRDLFNNYKGKKMLKPFTDLLDDAMSHYKIQLNLYKMLLENMTGLEVEAMEVVWLKANEEDIYQLFEIPNLTEKLLPYYE
tara:strand:- start:1243 stop:1977 length:735 start_codon:yes stop_codon:yes gene_type:complete